MITINLPFDFVIKAHTTQMIIVNIFRFSSQLYPMNKEEKHYINLQRSVLDHAKHL